MTVRVMTKADLVQVLDWAAAEGWNPGLDDAAAFHAADPGGFFAAEVDGRMVAAVSVVNHSDDFAFLGLYLCLPAWRGRGLGLAVWRAGLAHAGARCVGLDGVPAQQDNYVRSGFTRAGRTQRFSVQPGAGGGAVAAPPDRAALIAADRRATGVARPRFAAAWFTDTDTRRTLCLDPSDPARAFATYRQCGTGVKVGPLYANTLPEAEALLNTIPPGLDASRLIVDVPHSAPALAELMEARGGQAAFETARMYSGPPPPAQPPLLHGVATLELG